MAFWNALITNQIEPAEDNLGLAKEFTVNYHGYDYELVEIGDQCWFAENCRFPPQVSPSWLGYQNDGAAHAYVYQYDGFDVEEAKNSFMYNSVGVLYNRKAAIEDWPLCPSGWRVTSSQD